MMIANLVAAHSRIQIFDGFWQKKSVLKGNIIYYLLVLEQCTNAAYLGKELWQSIYINDE